MFLVDVATVDEEAADLQTKARKTEGFVKTDRSELRRRDGQGYLVDAIQPAHFCEKFRHHVACDAAMPKLRLNVHTPNAALVSRLRGDVSEKPCATDNPRIKE